MFVLSCFPAAPAALSADAPAPVTAPVVVDGVTLFLVRGTSAYPAADRAEAIADRIRAAAADSGLATSTIRVVLAERSADIVMGDKLLMSVLDADAEIEGIHRQDLARACARRIGSAIEAYRRDRLPRNLLIGVGASLMQTRGGENMAERRWRSQCLRDAVVVAAAIGSILVWAPAETSAQTPRQVFEKVAPSVVVIRARGRDVTAGGESRFAETGSGVLISKDGKVMTAAHVVHAMDEIHVQFLGGETVPARVVASEPAADLSLLQLDRVPPDSTVAVMADSDKVHVGDPVIIVGAPYGLAYSLSVGFISARWAPNTVYKTMPLAEFFQTTATINTGNSGGPMFAMNGEVIGIVSHNISKSGGSEGLGFVVTLNTAKQLLLERRSFWSGLEGMLLTDDLADLLNLPPRASGYIVKTVAKDSPGEHIGLRGATQVVRISGQDVPLGGDIILTVEGIAMSSANIMKIRDAMNKLPSGGSFKVTILRKGQVLELTGKVP